MSAIEERPAGAVVSAYGLRRPTPDDLRRSIERIYGEDADQLWSEICERAEVSTRPAVESFEPLLEAMHRHLDGAVRLCAEGFMIRANAFDHLFKAEAIVGSVS